METSARATVQADVMLRHHLYSDIDDRMKHFGEIQSIADELHRPIPEIAQLYEDVLEYLRTHAQVTDFLPVLVSKKVRELCGRKNTENDTVTAWGASQRSAGSVATKVLATTTTPVLIVR
jgi:hypothetical protein